MICSPSLLCADTSLALLSCEKILMLGWLPWPRNTLPRQGKEQVRMQPEVVIPEQYVIYWAAPLRRIEVMTTLRLLFI